MKTSRIARWAAVLVCLAQLAPASTVFYTWGANVYNSDTSVINISNLTAWSSGPADPFSMGLEADPIGGKVYWGFHDGEKQTWAIYRMDFNGGNQQQIVSPSAGSAAFALDVDGQNGKLYWGYHDIYRSELNGANSQLLIPIMSGGTVGGIAVDPLHGWIFWTMNHSNPALRGVYRSNLSGSGTILLVPTTSGPRGIDVDCTYSLGSKIYWGEQTPGGSRLMSADLNGGSVHLLTNTATEPVDVSLDLPAGKIYWGASSYGIIWRANLDGSSSEAVLGTSGNIVYGLSVVPGTYCPYFHGIYDVVNDLASGGLGGLETADGDYVMAAGARVNGAVDTDVVLLKTDDQGHPKWTLRYVKSRNEEMHAICEVGGSNFVIAGSAETSSTGDRDVYVLKTGHGGNALWASTFGTTYAIETGNSILSTSDGGSLISGMQRQGNGDCDAYLVKINANGALQWARAYDRNNIPPANGDYDEALAAIEIIPPTNGVKYLVTGRTGTNSTSTDVLLMGVSEAGVPVWSCAVGDNKTGAGLRQEIGYSIVRHPDGGVAVAGVAGKDGGLLLRATDNGDVLWANLIGLPGQEEFHSLVVALDGGLVMGGFSKQSNLEIASTDRSIVVHPPVPPLYSYRYWLVKTDRNGVLKWSRFYGAGLGRAEAYSLDNAAHGGYYLAGKLRADPSPGSVPYAVRTDSEGKVDFQNTNDPTCYQTVQPEVSQFKESYPITLLSRNEGIGHKVSANSQTLSLTEEIFCQGCTPCPLDTAWDSAGMEPQPGFYSFRDNFLMGNKVGDQLIGDYYAVAGQVAAVVAANPRLALELAEISKEINGVIQALQANPTETLRIQEATVAKARNLADAIMKELPADTANVLAPWVTWAADLQSLADALGLDVKVEVVDKAASPALVSVPVSTPKSLAGDKYTTPELK